ncbi:DUF485 domain-containing protein [Actinomadura macrotermitis]|nr:DUF485 domain-containing protein [Actinomadura macrotermitis]
MAQDERFRLLRMRFRRLALTVVATFMGWYLLYVLLSAFARGLMAQPVIGNINVALLLGVLQFASTFLLAWCYTAYARRVLDPLAQVLRAEADQAPGVPFARRAPHDADGGPRLRPGFGALPGHVPGAAPEPHAGPRGVEQHGIEQHDTEQRGREGWAGPVRPDPGWLR